MGPPAEPPQIKKRDNWADRTPLVMVPPTQIKKKFLTFCVFNHNIALLHRAVSSGGQSACSTRRRSLVQVQYRPFHKPLKLKDLREIIPVSFISANAVLHL